MKIRYFLIILFLFSFSAKAASDLYPFQSQQQQQQFVSLTGQLRCLVCQNESLLDSGAPLAVDLRNQVYQMVLQGKTDVEIKKYLVARYGDFVLFNPPVEKNTYLLWFWPVILFLSGGLIFMRVARSHKRKK